MIKIVKYMSIKFHKPLIITNKCRNTLEKAWLPVIVQEDWMQERGRNPG